MIIRLTMSYEPNYSLKALCHFEQWDVYLRHALLKRSLSGGGPHCVSDHNVLYFMNDQLSEHWLYLLVQPNEFVNELRLFDTWKRRLQWNRFYTRRTATREHNMIFIITITTWIVNLINKFSCGYQYFDLIKYLILILK